MQIVEIMLKTTPLSVFVKAENTFKKDDLVIINNSGSQELGVVCSKNSKAEPTENIFIERLATDADKTKNCENCKYARQLLPEIKKEADKLNLDMKVSFIATNLDRTKLIVNYTADERVDFRELIKILGAKFKTRIEMKQIGNRDETRAVGAIGQCGLECCCKRFLTDFDKVSIKMAKNQNIALNPTRINGMCGRLLCCLKYEDDYYAEMQKKMPKINSSVSTPDGKGKVTSTDFLKETVTVTFQKDEDTTEVKIYNLSDISKDKKEQ